VILQSNSDPDTKEIGRRIGERLKPGDVVSLYGELGAGKTTMVKGIASAFGIKERDITSPSFTIIAEYESEIPFNHIDLYRLSVSDVADLGLHEYLGRDAVSVVEWAERAEDELPDDAVKVEIRYTGEGTREITISGITI
jgi:tRNA threonylcarbamoyladenosine biosynthesis protein TsaE